MLRIRLNELPRSKLASYGVVHYNYRSDWIICHLYPSNIFRQSAKYIIAERMVFDSLGAFLHVDFFRGLIQGNAPRRCHNCGKFFLLTKDKAERGEISEFELRRVFGEM